jgi:hypothetical protein
MADDKTTPTDRAAYKQRPLLLEGVEELCCQQLERVIFN